MEGTEALDRVRSSLLELDRALKGTDLEQQAAQAVGALDQFQAGYYDFREICDNLYDGIHITDGEGKVLFINQAYTRTTGIRPAEILGRKVADIEAEGVLYRGSVTEQVLKRRERVNSVAIILKLDKEVLVTGNPVFDGAGNIKLVVTNTRDFPELPPQAADRAQTDLLPQRGHAAGDGGGPHRVRRRRHGAHHRGVRHRQGVGGQRGLSAQ